MAGGTYSYRQLEQLWVAGGGRASLAPLMAAIAMAESGGRADAIDSTDNGGTQTSWGLWQISNGTHSMPAANILDPLANARQAVAKWKTQGLGAWGTYTSGAYKKYLQGQSPVKSPSATGGAAFVDEAKQFLGVPYVWGGESPKGFDCSGLIQYVAQKLGLKNVPRTSEEQWAYVRHISREQLQPGDLVFYPGADGTNASPGHVAIYAGNNQIIQAPQAGEDVQQIPMPPGASGYGRLPGVGSATFAGTGGSGGGGGGGLFGWLGSVFSDLRLAGDALNPFAGATDVAQALGGLAAPFIKAGEAIDWFFSPNHWIRVGALVAGSALTITGIVTMTRTGRSYSVQVPGAGTVPAPGGEIAPAFGIAEVTVGAILLFVAFHNLPSSVTSFGGFAGYLAAQAQSGGRAG